MTEAILKIYGERIEAESQKRSAVVATIFAPEQTDDGLDFCRVSIPALFDKDKSIPGVDADQAKELVVLFVRDIFAGFGVSITAEFNPVSGKG